MASYKPVVVQAFPKFGEKIAQDAVLVGLQVPPCNCAVTAYSRIHIYGRCSQEPIETFSHFKVAAYCATYRDDGNLLVAGSEEGSIRLFDISGRAPLRQFDGRTKTDCYFVLCVYKFVWCALHVAENLKNINLCCLQLSHVDLAEK